MARPLLLVTIRQLTKRAVPTTIARLSRQGVRTNDIVILVNDETINAAMSHDKLIELLFSQTKDFSMAFQRAGESRDNLVVHFEKGAMGLMTEGKNAQIRVRNLIIGGQAHSKSVAIGDVVSGIGNKPLYEILQEPDNTEELTNHLKEMQQADQPIVVNFNGIANAKKAVAKKAHSAPPPAAKSPAKEDELASFKKLMIQGLEVNKIHAKPGPFGAKSRAQILYMDADLKMILCGTSKGTDTKKKFPIKDVAQIKPVNKHAKQFTIITGGKTKGELTVEVPSENARNLIMQRLAQLIREQKKA
jgi:hypothetical protein